MEAELDAGAAPDADANEGPDVNSPTSAAAVKVENVPSKHKCEETLLSLCRSYGISGDLYKPLCAKDGWGTPPPEASNALCVFEAMLEAGVKFPLHEVYNRILSHFNLAPGQLVPNAWRHLVGFVLLCDEVGVTPMAAVFRHYYKLCSKGNGWYDFKPNGNHLFKLDGGFHVNPRWRERFFFLESLTADNTWRCPQKLGEPVKEAYDLPDLNDAAWNVISKLEAAKRKRKSISLKKLIIDKSWYNHNFPVLPPLQEQVKSETKASDDDGATPSTHPAMKRLCFPATTTTIGETITPSRQLDMATTSSAPPGSAPAISPRSTVAGNELSRPQMLCQMIQETYMELRLANENLASEQAALAKALEDLEAEQSKARQLSGELQAVQAERDKALMQLKEMKAELSVRCAAQAGHSARLRQLKTEQATKVQRLEKRLQTAQAERDEGLGQLEELTKVVRQLREEFEAAEVKNATKLNKLVDEGKEAEAKLQQLTEELEAEKAKHDAEVNAVRAQCYSQLKAAAIKYIDELMPEPLFVMENREKLKKPKAWKHTQPITASQLKQMRDKFWDTAPHSGGQKEIWDALRVAAESDLTLAQTIVDSAGIIISNPDMTLCYDERGAKYELPKNVLGEPTNLIRDG